MVKIGQFVNKYWPDLLLLLLLLLTLPLFFYKLGQTSLVSWDEAWYAEIARNILKSGNLLQLTWNGSAYYDHPPMGFWLIALSFKLFGVNEFWARFPSTLFGVLGVISLYFLGKELFNRTVGFMSALALSSAVWFLYRARSGNLDVFLATFFLLTLFFAVKASKDKRFLVFFFLSFASLTLTKTLVPLTIIPVLLIIFFRSGTIKTKEMVFSLLLFLTLVGVWLYSQMTSYDNFIQRYLSVGAPGVKTQVIQLGNFNLMKEYLHSGVGKWFWPGMLGIIMGPFLLQRRFLILTIFFVSFFIPFIFSNKGQIWHLVPLFPIMILAFFGFFYVLVSMTITKISLILPSLLKINRKKTGLLKNRKIQRITVTVLILAVGLYIYFFQVKRIWYQFIDIPAFVSDEAILSKEAAKYPYPIFIDDDFTPAAVFYSGGKRVEKVWEHGLPNFFNYEKNFTLITRQWRLDGENIPKNSYKILKTDRDKILILKQS